MSLIEQVKQKIEQALSGSIVKVFDESADHVEHNPTGAHIKVTVIWKGFEGKTMVEQHQMVYNILKEEMKEKVHALRIEAKVN